MVEKNFYSLLIFVIIHICVVDCSDNCDSYRLPNNSYPLNYNLWLKLDVENDSNFFEGRIKIQIRIKEKSDSITLHSKGLNIENITLSKIFNKSDVTNFDKNLGFDYVRQCDFLIIKSSFELIPNDEILLDIFYNGYMLKAYRNTSENVGIVREEYEHEAYIFTKFEATHARNCFPCYDEPAIKSRFKIEVEHDSAYNAFSNMPLISRIENNASVKSSFQETSIMSTYLVSIFVSKFKIMEISREPIPQKIIARSSLISNGNVDFIAKNLEKMLKGVQNYFDVEFSIPKLDHVIAFGFETAIENWGIIGYSELYVYSPDKFRSLVSFLHEISHHYFGNLVTPKWWSYTWLKEGLAKHYETEIAKVIFPDQIIRLRDEEINRNNKAKRIDGHKSTSALNSYVESPENILDKFHYFTYYKGAAVVQMFQEAIGIETWKKGIKYYLKICSHSSTDPDNLHNAIQQAFDEDFPNQKLDIKKSMRTWENQAGYPLIKVSLENKNLKFTQRRKLLNEKYGSEIYTIPIFYTSPSYLNFSSLKIMSWMTEREMEILNFTDEWILINFQQYGYYDVEYDVNLWGRLINHLIKTPYLFGKENSQELVKMAFNAYNYQNWNCTMLSQLLSYFQHDVELDLMSDLLKSLKAGVLPKCLTEEIFETNLKDTMTIVFEKRSSNYNYSFLNKLACDIKIQKCSNFREKNMLRPVYENSDSLDEN